MSDTTSFKYYHYTPSLGASILFTIVFALTSSIHTYQLARTRTSYAIPLAVGGFFEFIGYTGRNVSAKQTPDWTLGPYITQSLFLLLAPALFAATVYMQLGRIVRAIHGEERCLIKTKWLTKIFVTGDVLSFLIQGGGGGIMAQDKSELGSNMIVGGLVLQLLFFGVFLIVSICFDVAVRKRPTLNSKMPDMLSYKHLMTLYVASVLILVRNLFRVVEYVQGNEGYLLGQEWTLYIFDALLMLVVMVMFNLVHPSEVNAMLKGGRFLKNGFKLDTFTASPV